MKDIKKDIKKEKNKEIKKEKIFNNKDYISGDGFLTSVWGPLAWTFLHTISFNYPNEPTTEDKKNYRDFILSLVNVLPCKYCRENLKKNFKKYPLTMDVMKNRESFSRYIYNLHELVNTNLGKVSGLSYEDVRETYEHFRARCSIDKEKNKEKNNKTKNNKTKNNKTKKINKRENGKYRNNISISHKKTTKNKNIEKGCTEPLYGKKAKSIIKIVPKEKKCNTFQIDKQCIKTRN